MIYPGSTFSIVGYDEKNKEIGVAVQSKFLSVGALVPWVEAGVGAIATQAKTNSSLGKDGLKLLKDGLTPKEVIHRLLNEDKDPHSRQIGIVDFKGNSYGYTGKNCIGWAGEIFDKNFSCQGNVLLGKSVLLEMEKVFKNIDGDLAERLVNSLIAAQNAGGERRGRQSSALIVKKLSNNLFGELDSYIDIRVDDSNSPILDLKKLLQKHRIEYATNHSDKYYPFNGETMYKFTEILISLGLINRFIEDDKNIKDIIIQCGKKYDIKIPLKGNLISGELVYKVMNDYY